MSSQLEKQNVPLLSHGESANEAGEEKSYRVYPTRFYILGAFGVISFAQSLLWLTFSPVAKATKEFYHLCDTPTDCAANDGPGQDTVDLFLNWGPIIYLLTIFPVMWLASKKNALKNCIMLSAVLELLCVSLRAIPTLFFESGSPPFYAVSFVHVAQICNAAVGPLTMATPTLLSSVWFPEHERATATAIAIVVNNCGALVGFFAPFLVGDNPENIKVLLWIHFTLVCCFSILVFSYFPSQPPSPPSSSSRSVMALSQGPDFMAEVKSILRLRSFNVLAICGGAIGGVYNVWSGSLDTILPHSIVSTNQCAILGFLSTLFYCGGGFAGGPLMNTQLFRRHYKRLLIICLFVSTLLFSWFAVSLPMIGIPTPLMNGTFFSLAFIIVGCGLFLGATNPIYYEFGVEITFPIQEGTSAGLITIQNNVGALIFLVLKNSIPITSLNLLMAGTVFVALLSTTLGVKEKYLRKDYEVEHAH